MQKSYYRPCKPNRSESRRPFQRFYYEKTLVGKEERAPKMNSRFLPRNSGCQRQAPLRPSTHLGKICTKNPLSLSLISPKNFCGGISLPRRGRKRGGKERKKVESNPGSPGDMRKDKVVKKVGTLAQFLIPSQLAGGGRRRPNEDLESDRDSFLSFLPPLSLFRLRQN